MVDGCAEDVRQTAPAGACVGMVHPVGLPWLACGPGCRPRPIGGGADRAWFVAGRPHARFGGNTEAHRSIPPSSGGHRSRCVASFTHGCTPSGARSPAWCSHDDSSSWRPRASWRRVACLFVSRVHRWQHGWATDREAGSRPSRRRACYGGCGDPLPSGGRTMRRHLGENLRELALACCRLALHASQRACPFLAREPGSRRAIVSGSNAACPVTGQPQRFARPAATLGGSSGRIEPCRWRARGSRRVLQGEL